MNLKCKRTSCLPAAVRADARLTSTVFRARCAAALRAALLLALASGVAAAPGAEQRTAGRASIPAATVKLGGAVEIDARVTDVPTPGSTGRVEIRVTAAGALESVDVSLGDAGALEVVYIDGATTAATLGAGEPLVLTLGVLAPEAGRHLLPVFVRADSGRGPVASSVVVPIEISGGGNATALAPADAADRSGNGDSAEHGGTEEVRSMRADETIR